MTPRSARAPRGERAVGAAPRHRGANTTLLAALSAEGIVAAMTLPGAADRPAFDAFVREVLAPALEPGRVVIWDNLGVHKGDAARGVIEAAGCELRFLPADSPDFSPIEHAFAKRKTHLRRAEARTRQDLDAAIAAGRDAVTAAAARGWYGHCGYPLPSQS